MVLFKYPLPSQADVLSKFVHVLVIQALRHFENKNVIKMCYTCIILGLWRHQMRELLQLRTKYIFDRCASHIFLCKEEIFQSYRRTDICNWILLWLTFLLIMVVSVVISISNHEVLVVSCSDCLFVGCIVKKNLYLLLNRWAEFDKTGQERWLYQSF